MRKRRVETFSPSTRDASVDAPNATSSLYRGVSVTMEGALAAGAARTNCGSVNESRKKRSTSRASGDAGSADGFAVVRISHACSTVARPDLVASALAACAATWVGSFRREKSIMSRRRCTTSRRARAVSLPASSSSARSSASTSTTTPKHASSAAPATATCSATSASPGPSSAAVLSAVNATMARPLSATSTSAATACLLTTAHAMRSNATRSVSTSDARCVASATPSTETHRNANVSTVCAKTAGTMEYVMLTLREAPALENTGAESIAGNSRYPSAPPRSIAPPKNADVAAPRSRENVNRRVSSSEIKSRSRSERTISFHALAKTSHVSETASTHSTALGDGSTNGRASFVSTRRSNSLMRVGKLRTTLLQPSETPRQRSRWNALANPRNAR
mmetsp:Transcript_1531/g.6406  ORF Transcript_1531/g.6406 Transcript_1531/m.6406 type:complete len:394 (-) Transcript_1531:4241-5422(-)